MVTKQEFKALFLRNVESAISLARPRVPHNVDGIMIEMHGGGASGEWMTIDEAVNRLYINKFQFYKIIDVGVRAIDKEKWIVFTRISGHSPSDFSSTWNNPTGNGPFKVIYPSKIEIINFFDKT